MNTECFHEVPPVPAGVYEPHCVMTWREQIAGMDDMIPPPGVPLAPEELNKDWSESPQGKDHEP